jgi:hypothetical protein
VRYEQRLSLSVGLLRSIDQRLFSAAPFAKALLPPDYHDRLNNRDSVTPEDYDRIADRNNRLCVQLGLQYLWSCAVITRSSSRPAAIRWLSRVSSRHDCRPQLVPQ